MTDPLLPPDVDLRGLDYMPLFGNHLFGSEFNAASNDSEWRAAVTLWWAAWNQVPAGSLPNDDTALCRLADLGRDVKTWKKLRAKAMHGFVLCSDGRMYHEFLCRQAAIAWDKRVKERERKANWRSQQDAKKSGRDADVPGTRTWTKTGTSQSQNADVPADGNGMDGNGRDDRNTKDKGAGTPTLQPRTPGADACLRMKAAGLQGVNPSHPKLLALLQAGITPDELAEAAADAAGKGKPFAYALATAEGRRRDAAVQPLPDKPGPTVPGPSGPDPELVRRAAEDAAWKPPSPEVKAMLAQTVARLKWATT